MVSQANVVSVTPFERHTVGRSSDYRAEPQNTVISSEPSTILTGRNRVSRREYRSSRCRTPEHHLWDHHWSPTLRIWSHERTELDWSSNYRVGSFIRTPGAKNDGWHPQSTLLCLFLLPSTTILTTDNDEGKQFPIRLAACEKSTPCSLLELKLPQSSWMPGAKQICTQDWCNAFRFGYKTVEIETKITNFESNEKRCWIHWIDKRQRCTSKFSLYRLYTPRLLVTRML